MKIAQVSLESLSPLSFSRPLTVPRKERENDEDYEARTWRERAHYSEKTGEVVIPPMMFKNTISVAAKFLSMPIPGDKRKTYTKHIEAGIMVMDPVPLGVTRENIQMERMFVPSDGRRGGTSRVWKNFPIIPSWTGEATFYVLDHTITEQVFLKHLETAGMFIGLGRFRPRNNGYYGRFKVNKIKWQEE